MPFIPHTEADVRHMLEVMGISSVEDLFGEIPAHLRCRELQRLPDGLSEMEMLRLMSERAQSDAGALCFIGAGAYEHHIPAAVWDIASRGEFMTAYTPYQAEASQGTLQLIYEFQSMMVALTGMDVSNASLYDGASALAEAVLMAVRAQRKSSRRVLLAGSLNPFYRQTVEAIVTHQGIELVSSSLDFEQLQVSVADLEAYAGQDFAALVIAQPNFFGTLEDVHGLTDWAHQNHMLVIAVVNPTALAVLAPPGQWGSRGADIAVGDGQPLGLPLSSGGPYFGFMCCRQELVRQMPGRIIGRTVDLEGKTGFSLTLQAREQHIRRSKATSNICTNQGLAVTAATIHMSLLGAEGLARVACVSHQNSRYLRERLEQLDPVEVLGAEAFFHEFVYRVPGSARVVLEALARDGILGGYDLSRDYPELEGCILVCATETRTRADLDRYVSSLKEILDQKEVGHADI